jgi:hypothetical protein
METLPRYQKKNHSVRCCPALADRLALGLRLPVIFSQDQIRSPSSLNVGQGNVAFFCRLWAGRAHNVQRYNLQFSNQYCCALYGKWLIYRGA